MIAAHPNSISTFARYTPCTNSQKRSNSLVRLAKASAVAALIAVGGLTAGDVGAQDDACWSQLHPNTRSIQLIEGREPPVEVKVGGAPPALAVHPNIRSILLIEGMPISSILTDQDEPPALAVHPNIRSILLIEGREPPVETAQSGC